MEKGLTYTSTTQVTPENTALTMGSGDLPVFATPAMVALMENAAMNAVKDQLEEGSSTVGASIQISLRASEKPLRPLPYWRRWKAGNSRSASLPVTAREKSEKEPISATS